MKLLLIFCLLRCLPGVVPVRVTGDGNCLFHAVSRALVEYMYPTSNKSLRACAAAELLSNKSWYAEQMSNVPHLWTGTRNCSGYDYHPRLTGDESTINITSCQIVPIKLGIMSDQNQECPIKVSFPRDNVRSKFFPYI